MKFIFYFNNQSETLPQFFFTLGEKLVGRPPTLPTPGYGPALTAAKNEDASSKSMLQKSVVSE